MAVPFVPKNRAATEHRGGLDRVVFCNPDEPFVILSLTDGATVCGPATAEQFAKGTTYRFLGKWEDNAARGPRFRFSTFVVHATHNRVGVVKYLVENCEGIGNKTAERIYEKFRGESVETLRTDPGQVAADCGLPLDLCTAAAEQLADNARFEDTRIELFGLFSGRGFQGKLIDRAIRRWNVRAPAAIKKNPFALLGMPSAGFKRCDKLWVDLNLPRDSRKRCAIVAAHLVRSDPGGNTWVSADDLGARLTGMIPGADVMRTFRLALRARLLKKYRDRGNNLWLSTYHRATSEERITAALDRLSSVPCVWPTDRIPVSRREGDRLPSGHQVERLLQATAGPVGMLLGGPGCGKTHVTGYLLREVIAEFGRDAIVVCAPTGKAAVRASQALALARLVGLTARTIHTTLGIGRNGNDGEGWEFTHHAGNPLDCRFLVCDETSMNDTDLMADLLDACPIGCHVLFIGDPHQLPPVGHGAPLRDLIAGRVPHGELTEVRRNAGLIVRACQRIKDGKPFEVASSIDLEAELPKNLRLIEAKDETQARDALVEVQKRMTRFHPVWQTQVIVARNVKGEISRKKLNELLHPLLNPDGHAVKGNPFKVGDKIICTRNGHLHRVELLGPGEPGDSTDPRARDAARYDVVRDDHGRPLEVYVANGEIGRVCAIGPKLTVARFSEAEALVKIPMGKQREEDDEDGDESSGLGCNFDLAYAVTGHKMQGSESPCVIVMGDEQAGQLTSREWLYTAISRASKLCILIGTMSTFNKMTARRTLNRRKTFLKERILDLRYAEL